MKELKTERALLLGVMLDTRQDMNAELTELTRLAETAGLLVVETDYQHIREITPATVFGSGKVEEVKEFVESNNINVVVVDFNLSNSQLKNLTEELNAKVIDRMGLILDIFASRAISQEGKLQVELALAKYTLPRLASLVGTSGRFGGGVGMRGPGETKLELSRRVVENNILRLEKEIKKIKTQRELKRQNRFNSSKKNVAIIGYTNAGKSTLLNLISKAGIYADDKLFATLDTTSRNVYLCPEVQIVLTDTVGFISKLPHELVEAFASTLEEASLADLILHVVDISNKDYLKQMDTVNKTLEKIGASQIPQIIVYNKIDNFDGDLALKDNEVAISAKNNIGVDKLKEKIIEILK